MSCKLTYKGKRYNSKSGLTKSVTDTPLFSHIANEVGTEKAFKYQALLETPLFENWKGKKEFTKDGEVTIDTFNRFYNEEVFLNDEKRRGLLKQITPTLKENTDYFEVQEEDWLPDVSKENEGEFKDEFNGKPVQVSQPVDTGEAEAMYRAEKAGIAAGKAIDLVNEFEVVNPLIRAKQDTIRRLNKRIKVVETSIGNTKITRVRVEHIKNKQQLEKDLDRLAEEILSLQETSNLSLIHDMLLVELEWVEKLIDSDKFTFENADSHEITTAKNILKSWSNFIDVINSEFTYNEAIEELFGPSQMKIKRIKDKVLKKEARIAIEGVKKTYGFTDDSKAIKTIYDPRRDMSKMRANLTDMSKSHHILLQTMQRRIGEVNREATLEIQNLYSDFSPIAKAATAKLKELGLDWDIFYRKALDAEGNEVGLKTTTVTPVSEKYHNARRALNPFYNKKKKSWGLYNKWLTENNHLIDIDRATNDRVAYRAELVKLVPSENAVDLALDDAIKKQEAFQREFEDQEMLTLENYSEEDTAKKMKYWQMFTNPAAYVKSGNGILTTSTGKQFAMQPKFVSILPKTTVKGLDTGYYDSNYALIQQHPELAAFQEFFVTTMHELNDLLPGGEKNYFTIPLYEKSITDAYSDEGLAAGYVAMKDELTRVLRGGEAGEDSFINEDDEGNRQLASNFYKGTEKDIRRQYEILLQTWELDNVATLPDKAVKRQLWQEATDKVVKTKDMNLVHSLRAFAALAITYQHKAALETPLLVMQSAFKNNVKKARTDLKGNVIDSEGLSEEALLNYNFQMDAAVDTFFGIPKKKGEEAGKKIKYNKKEQDLLEQTQALTAKLEDKKARLDIALAKGSISEVQHTSELESIATREKQIEEIEGQLGGKHTFGGYLNAAMKWLQLKSLGWNVTSGLANMAFGVLTNAVEGAGGLFYTDKDIRAGYRLVLNSIGKAYGIKTDTGIKIRTLMDEFNFLKKASEEFFDQGKTPGFLNPFIISNVTEYVNQAPVMIAVFKNIKIKNLKGEERDLWDGFDKVGNWNEAEFGAKSNFKEVLTMGANRTDKAIRNNHGNYDNASAPLAIKRDPIWKVTTQFRTWMFEGFANRFEDGYTDYELGMERKGRYTTMKELGFKTAMKELFKAVTWLQQGKELSQVDAANMRKNAREVIIYASLLAVTALLQALIGDKKEDDDDSFLDIAGLNILLNLMNRVNTDIAFYSSPVQFRTLVQDIIPLMSLLKDVSDLTEMSYKLMLGKDVIKTGTHADERRSVRALGKFPVFASILKVHDNTKQVYKKNKGFIQDFEEAWED